MRTDHAEEFRMFTLLTLCAIIVGGILYTQTGHQLGKLALKAWKEEDNETTTSFLLFPLTHLREEVGSPVAPCFARGMDEDIYKVLMALIWPAKLALNAATIATIVGPAKIARSLSVMETYEKRLADARRERRLLAAKTGTAEVKVAMLKAMREELDEQIIDAEAELDADREHRIMELRDARDEHDREIMTLEALTETDEWCAHALPERSYRVTDNDDDDPSAPVEATIALLRVEHHDHSDEDGVPPQSERRARRDGQHVTPRRNVAIAAKA